MLWDRTVELLSNRSSEEPLPPKDWKLEKVPITCSCSDCRELAAFAADPEDSVHRFRVRQDRRGHLHQVIDQNDLDMTHVTERRGSPYTLVCTKTRRSYTNRVKQYERDRECVERLRQIAPDSA